MWGWSTLLRLVEVEPPVAIAADVETFSCCCCWLELVSAGPLLLDLCPRSVEEEAADSAVVPAVGEALEFLPLVLPFPPDDDLLEPVEVIPPEEWSPPGAVPLPPADAGPTLLLLRACLELGSA